MRPTVPVVILAGGRGARFDHESQVLPKPMIELAGLPILRHIIDGFVAQGFREFIVAAGYLVDKIYEYAERVGSRFAWDYERGYRHYVLRDRDKADPVFIKVWDTGLHSHTGERVTRLAEVIGERRFVLTYGDGLCDVDVNEVITYHQAHVDRTNRRGDVPPIMTVTAVRPPGRFGMVNFEENAYHVEDQDFVRSFEEKPRDMWINGGFMVVDPGFIGKYLSATVGHHPLETEAMPAAARAGRIVGYKHYGYWQCVDTRRDLESIQSEVTTGGGRLPWRRDMMMPDQKEEK